MQPRGWHNDHPGSATMTTLVLYCAVVVVHATSGGDRTGRGAARCDGCWVAAGRAERLVSVLAHGMSRARKVSGPVVFVLVRLGSSSLLAGFTSVRVRNTVQYNTNRTETGQSRLGRVLALSARDVCSATGRKALVKRGVCAKCHGPEAGPLAHLFALWPPWQCWSIGQGEPVGCLTVKLPNETYTCCKDRRAPVRFVGGARCPQQPKSCLLQEGCACG